VLAIIVFVVIVGLIVGSLFIIGQRDRGWVLLTAPWAAAVVGIPSALIFSYWLPQLPDPFLRIPGPWRAIELGACIGASVGLALLWLSRNPKRRRDIFERAGPVVLFSLIGCGVGAAWGAVKSLI
jgi:hypothetical protein